MQEEASTYQETAGHLFAPTVRSQSATVIILYNFGVRSGVEPKKVTEIQTGPILAQKLLVVGRRNASARVQP
jgi:hypothetical protein